MACISLITLKKVPNNILDYSDVKLFLLKEYDYKKERIMLFLTYIETRIYFDPNATDLDKQKAKRIFKIIIDSDYEYINFDERKLFAVIIMMAYTMSYILVFCMKTYL